MKAFTLLAPLLGATFCVSAPAAPQRPPNVIVILADDLGYQDLGCQGSKEALTPRIDQLAREGVRCTAGYVTAPQCAPSRAGLISGRSQSSFGFDANFGKGFDPIAKARGWGLPHEVKTIAEYLKPLGYATAILGKWNLGYSTDHNPIHHGFDDFVGFMEGGNYFLGQPGGTPILDREKPVRFASPVYLTDYLSGEAVSYIQAHKDKPFFLYLAQFAPHVPLQATQKYLDRFRGVKNPHRRAYLAMISALDDGVGAVLDTLKKEGLDRDTLVFFLSDNGGPSGDNDAIGENSSINLPFSGVKGDLLEGGIRVPYIVRWTGTLPAGTTYDAPISSLDIAATAIAVAGGKPQPQLDGIDIVPYLAKQKPPLDDRTLYWRFTTLSAVRSGDYKLIRFYPGVEELNDIRTNFTEDKSRNLDTTKNPEIYSRLSGSLTAWTKSLPLPMWKVAFPGVTVRSLERHDYAGYEAYRAASTSDSGNREQWLVTKEVYKAIYGAPIDEPKDFQTN